jgi:hypothetical protein
MAFQFQVDPDLAAKVTYAGIMEGARGFSQGIDKLGAGLAKGLEKQKDDAKMFKSLQEYADSAGIATKDQTTPMDLDSLKGLVEGTIAKQHNKEALQRLQMNDQLQKLRDVQMKRYGQDVDQEGKRAGFWDELSGGASVPRAGVVGRVDEMGAPIEGSMTAPPGAMPGQAQPLDSTRIFNALRKSGYAPKPEELDGFISSVQKLNPQSNVPQVHNLGKGYVGFTLPGTRNFDVRPDLSANPDMSAQAITDEDGNVLGHGVPNGKGGFTFLKPGKGAATGEMLPVTDPTTGEAIPGFGMDGSGKVHDFRSLLEKARGAGGGVAAPKGTRPTEGPASRLPTVKGAPATPTEEPARPASAEEFRRLPKGALYINPADGKLYRKK